MNINYHLGIVSNRPGYTEDQKTWYWKAGLIKIWWISFILNLAKQIKQQSSLYLPRAGQVDTHFFNIIFDA